MNPSIADLRKDYSSQTLRETDIELNPIDQFQKWWTEAVNSQVDEVNAMTLATASSDGMPSARIMLLKGFDKSGFVFFTNYKSYKAMHLEENPKACLVFFWKELERQVRITGLVKRASEKDSDEYFLSRPAGSQVGAWASSQSQVIQSREWLENRYLQLTEEFKQKELKRPPHWGGYVVTPVIMEFWQGRPSRLHDRIQYSLEENGSWKIERLSP
ncbi:MAG TPA: pyridoxamine 5'-phosphate oxidase [Flavisolibacter sp.]|nr:pyridoxamine 5'-phosphate oxidase [Flavisolibacter sp.]